MTRLLCLLICLTSTCASAGIINFKGKFTSSNFESIGPTSEISPLAEFKMDFELLLSSEAKELTYPTGLSYTKMNIKNISSSFDPFLDEIQLYDARFTYEPTTSENFGAIWISVNRYPIDYASHGREDAFWSLTATTVDFLFGVVLKKNLQMDTANIMFTTLDSSTLWEASNFETPYVRPTGVINFALEVVEVSEPLNSVFLLFSVFFLFKGKHRCAGVKL